MHMLILLGLAVATFGAHQETMSLENPIRRVVKLLQKMQSSVEAEGEKEKKLFEEFMCYCKTGTNDLTASIDAAESKLPQVSSALEKAEATKVQLEKDLKQHKANVVDAKQTMATAKALREKEAAAFAK